MGGSLFGADVGRGVGSGVEQIVLRQVRSPFKDGFPVLFDQR